MLDLVCHDKARPHKAAVKEEAMQQLRFECLSHPPCSLDLASSDYHVFGQLKELPPGRMFIFNDEVTEAVQTWIRYSRKHFPRERKTTHEVHQSSRGPWGEIICKLCPCFS